MNLVFQVKSRLLVQKLRSGKDFTEPERKGISDSFVDMGRDAIEPLSKCLSHGTARPTAIDVLGRILNNKTLNEYLDLLGSPNPAVVSECAVLCGGAG